MLPNTQNTIDGGGKTIVVEDVPAFLRNHYRDTLIEGEAIITFDELLEKERWSQEYAPVYPPFQRESPKFRQAKEAR